MMESLLNELVDTYRLLLNNESLRKAESTNKIPAQVLEDIARCQARIFELYGEMATGKLSTSASIVIRLVCRIAISLHNRYGQYDKYCRFHRKSGCTVCPYVFPTELYVKKFDSIVKPECWDLTAAVENTEKLLVKMSKLLEENGEPSEITEGSLELLLKLRKWAAFEAILCDGKGMREVMPLFKSAKGKKEELKARTPSKLFAQYCLSLDREMTKLEAMRSRGELLDYLPAETIKEYEEYISTFIMVVLEAEKERMAQSSTKRPHSVEIIEPSVETIESANPEFWLELRSSHGEEVWAAPINGDRIEGFISDLNRLVAKFSSQQNIVNPVVKKRIKQDEVYVQIEKGSAAVLDENVANTQEDIVSTDDSGSQQSAEPAVKVAPEDFVTQAPETFAGNTQQAESQMPYTQLPDDAPDAAGIVNYGSDDDDEEEEKESRHLLAAEKENSTGRRRLPDSPDLISTQQIGEMADFPILDLPPLDEFIGSVAAPTSPVHRIASSQPSVDNERQYRPLSSAEALKSPSVRRTNDSGVLLEARQNFHPSASRHPLHSSSPEKYHASASGPPLIPPVHNRRAVGRKKLWTLDEIEALAEAHSRYPRQWSLIIRHYGNRFQQRSQVDLKDKVRNERLRIERATPPGMQPDYGPWA